MSNEWDDVGDDNKNKVLLAIGGTDGCYMKQFQLDRFLDHLTVIIRRHAVTLNLQSRSKVG